MHHHRLLLHLILLTALTGCAGFIKGVTNTNLHKAPEPSASYTIEVASGESVIARKLVLMLDHQIQKLGFMQADSPSGGHYRKILLLKLASSWQQCQGPQFSKV